MSKAKAKVESEILKIEDEKQQDLLREALWEMDELVEKTVGALEQTVAKDLRAAVKAGKADRDELLALSRNAFCDVADNIKPEYKQALKKNMLSWQEYLTDCIESKVLEVKALSDIIEIEPELAKPVTFEE